MIAVDKREVDPASGLRELGEQLGQQDLAVALVEGHVGGRIAQSRTVQVDRMNLDAVSGDPLETAALSGADLDRQRRP